MSLMIADQRPQRGRSLPTAAMRGASAPLLQRLPTASPRHRLPSGTAPGRSSCASTHFACPSSPAPPHQARAQEPSRYRSGSCFPPCERDRQSRDAPRSPRLRRPAPAPAPMSMWMLMTKLAATKLTATKVAATKLAARKVAATAPTHHQRSTYHPQLQPRPGSSSTSTPTSAAPAATTTRVAVRVPSGRPAAAGQPQPGPEPGPEPSAPAPAKRGLQRQDSEAARGSTIHDQV